ncbi:hypothetical protein E2C01_036625 [Portunus trituberculatus]|uniref:Uncharacterized protein n=1 Tax=Portunus trituberculatus TaxID=210409 RepID=A0A5B7F611_PORTR|nr:hypothetical protein [Portunus trituberculatus]
MNLYCSGWEDITTSSNTSGGGGEVAAAGVDVDAGRGQRVGDKLKENEGRRGESEQARDRVADGDTLKAERAGNVSSCRRTLGLQNAGGGTAGHGDAQQCSVSQPKDAHLPPPPLHSGVCLASSPRNVALVHEARRLPHPSSGEGEPRPAHRGDDNKGPPLPPLPPPPPPPPSPPPCFLYSLPFFLSCFPLHPLSKRHSGNPYRCPCHSTGALDKQRWASLHAFVIK